MIGRTGLLIGLATAVMAAGLSASAQSPAQNATPAGYLAPGVIDAARVVGPPPTAGSGEEAADLAAYRAGAAGAGSARWRQAQADDSLEWPVVLHRYACAIDAKLEAGKAPATLRLLERVMTDVDAVGRTAKDAYRRPRPFAADDPAAPVCLDIRPERRATSSFTYPSGHATLGTAWGLVLTEAAPGRAGPIGERTRDFILSRQVCRVHYPSDLHAGERLGAAIFASLQSSPEFQADLAAARAEIAAAPKPTGCGG
jgi:acid phosphatase (class A)